MSRWRRVVRRELQRYRTETGHDVLERQEFLDQSRSILQQEFPNNRTPGQKFSQVMQQLRDRDEVEFVDSGTYRILSLALEPTSEGYDFIEVSGEPGDPEWPSYGASEYKTTVGARSMPAAFRNAILDRYGHRCPVSGVDHDRLLDVAHVLSWSDYPDHRTDPGNVLALDKTHHAAFDAGLFTLDGDFRIHVAPDFESESEVLRRTLVDSAGSKIQITDDAPLAPEHLDRHNRQLDWW